MSRTSDIREHMDVICSCGTSLGKVDCIEDDLVKLTRINGRHHWIPGDWIDHVDDMQVHLNKNSEEARRNWSAAVSTVSFAG
jgi:hypothetical protein